MSDSAKAVFLSYASQDAEAARRIADALRAAGVEVWFDQSELRGGDAWDQKIRRQIKECALFVPVISQHTQERLEGYFRLEWRLAEQRTHLMARGKPFLVPVVVDGTRDSEAHVPESFTEVQWTKLPGGGTPAAFCERVKVLLRGGSELEPGRSAVADKPRPPRRDEGVAPPLKPAVRGPRWMKPVLASAGLVVIALAVTLWQRTNQSETGKPPAVPPSAAGAGGNVSPARELAEHARAIARQPSLSRVQLDTAAELCERALQLDPTDPLVWAIAADVELYYLFPYGYDISDERRRRVQERIARGASLDPDSFDVRVVRAKVLAHAIGTPASMAEAEKMFRALLTEHPGDHRLVTELAEVLRDQRRYDEAAKLFESIDEFEIAGWSYFQAGESRAALAAVSRAPRSVTGLQLAATLEYCGNEDLAAAQAAIDRLEPSELLAEMPATVAMRVAMYRRDPGRMLELAKGLSRDYLDSNAFNGPRAYFTGLAHAMAGRPAQADAEWRAGLTVVESMLKAAPDDRRLLVWSAWLHAALKDTATAEAIFARSQALAGLTGDSLDLVNYPVLLELRKKEALLAGAEDYFRTKRPLWQIMHAELRFGPEADFLRGDPRLEKLLHDYLPDGVKPLDDPAVTTDAPKPDEKSVAVLAFANLSDDKDNEYFSDGISEELLNVLAKIPGLKVTARTSSFYFKGRDVPVPEIARTLGVAYVVEGSVRKAGDRVRIAAQLVKAADGFQVWSDTFTRDLKDVFAVQDEIAGLIAQQLQLKLGDAAPASRAVNPEAHQLYLQGKYFLNEFSPDSLKRAIALLQQAVDTDPTFAPAWVALSRAGSALGGYGDTRREVDDGYALARRAAEKALALDPNLPGAYVALAEVQNARDFDWKGEAASVHRAQALAPADFEVIRSSFRLVYSLGQLDRCLELGVKIVALDPVNPSARVDYAIALNAAGRFAEAETQFRRIVELNPAAPWGHAGVSLNFAMQGRFDEAAAEAVRDRNPWSRLFVLALAQWGQGKTKASDATLQELIKSYADVAAYQVADAYAFRPDADRAFEWLERAYRQRDPGLTWSKSDPVLRKIHADPRWEVFMRKMGLADERLK